MAILKKGSEAEDRSREVLKRLPKEQRISHVMYVYVVLKHCETAEICLDLFHYDIPLKDFFK